jgi:hypothetical protein
MTLPREPRIHPVPITALRPTQITVGMREVKAKRKSWRDHPDKKKADFLGKHLIPVIWGPKEEYYVIDHHHLTLALHQEGVKQIATTVVADLRRLHRDDVPKRISSLVDDPYRSLAGELRQSGGFAKDTTPFSEFLWADFLRRRIKPKMLDDDFPDALVRALKLAKSGEADYLPGWCGPIA